jgi:positive regulator of sigma E activity
MNNFLDKLQQAWQSQCSKPIDVKPDQLLKVARHERLVQFCVDIGMISFFSCVGILMAGWAFRDIQKDWPWLISSASVAWVVGYILFHRWHRRHDAAHYDEPLLAHVEWSIKDIEHQMWLDRYSPWWYILPITLGCMIPPVFFFAMDLSKRPLLDNLISLLRHEAVFAATFTFAYLIMKFGVRSANEKHRQELQALRALRESLLNTGE